MGSLGRVVVTGAGGLVGLEVARVFAREGEDVRPFLHVDLDVADPDSVRDAFRVEKPRLVLHCAAMTNVDACETNAKRAYEVNAEGCRNVAEAANDHGATVIAISTDYVFDGTDPPYAETDETAPIQVYGASKLAGEQAIAETSRKFSIIRSAWIYGRGGKNFLSKLPELARSQASITAVVDQRGSPTYAPDLAEAIYAIASRDVHGTYHVVNDETCTFAEFCEAAVEILSSELRVEHVKLEDLGRPAPRPKDTSLVGPAWLAAGYEQLRPWREAAEAFLR